MRGASKPVESYCYVCGKKILAWDYICADCKKEQGEGK